MQKLYYNGTILTMEEEGDEREALLISDDRILGAGSLEELKRLADDSAEMVDLGGSTVMPGFIDGHSHISMVIQMSSAVDLSECEDFEQIIRILDDYKEENQMTPEGVIMGFGYDHNFLPGGGHPTKEYLNQVSEEIPVFVLHTSSHMCCANDAALRLAGITAETEDPEGGKIGRKPGSREPDGYLEEAGMLSVRLALEPRIHFDLDKGFYKAQELYLSNGITTVQDGAAAKETVDMMKGLAARGMLQVDVISYPLVTEGAGEIFAENPDCDEKYWNHFKLGGYKAVLDGSPQGKSAWLTEPYEDSEGYCAYPWFKDEQAEAFMQAAVDDNRQILVHCNGDAAGDQFLNAYEKALARSKNPNKGNLRPVMIHCQTARDDQLDRMAGMGMIASIFVGHVFYWGDVHVRNLGLRRGSRVSPCRSAVSRGVVVDFHQDTPVTRPKMLHSVWCAVNRITRGQAVIGPQQRISVYEALKAVTINGAYSYFEEHEKGSIHPGKLADLVVLDRNPMAVDPMEIRDIEVLATIKEGKLVYSRK